MFRSKKLAIVAAGAVAALALGSFAFAAIPDGGGVIHACYNKGTGAVRVTDTVTNLPKGCTVKETALDWNQQGGTSKAFTASAGYVELPANTSTEVVSRTLPPGTYVISAKTYVMAHGLNIPTAIINCWLDAAGANASSNDYAYGNVSSNGIGPVLVATLALQNNNTWMLEANGGTVSVACHPSQPIEARLTKITALQVDSIDS